jgi:hypothetical protein
LLIKQARVQQDEQEPLVGAPLIERTIIRDVQIAQLKRARLGVRPREHGHVLEPVDQPEVALELGQHPLGVEHLQQTKQALSVDADRLDVAVPLDVAERLLARRKAQVIGQMNRLRPAAEDQRVEPGRGR